MIYLLLAAFNEEKDLPGLLEEIRDQHWPWAYRIILVNDGSTDSTRQVAERYHDRLPLSIIDHASNQGLGSALNTGFSAIAPRLNDTDMLVTMDADHTHPANLIPIMKEIIESGGDIVIASRFRRGARETGLSFHRRILSRMAGFLLRVMLPLHGVRDYTSGYRMFSGRTIRFFYDAYKPALVTERGFAATVEILLKAHHFARKIVEIPLELQYQRKSGPSKIKIMTTVTRYLRLIAQHKFDRSSLSK